MDSRIDTDGRSLTLYGTRMASSISKYFLLAASLVLGLGSPVLRADLDANATPKAKKKPTPLGITLPTAVAETAAAEVERGGEISIRLRGISRGGGQVEFRLSQKPQHGRILRSKTVGLDTLEVVYRHSGDAQSDTDSFVFAVRASGTGPFSPGEARIRILTQPSRLLVPESLVFPGTLVGQTATDSFVVVNEGGTPTRGVITISLPWKISGPANYDLQPREKRKVTVLFAPTSSGSLEGQLTFETGERPIHVALQGEAVPTFLASPAKLVLAPTLDGKRAGTVSLQNNTPETITIEVESKFNLPKTVALQFGEARDLIVEDTGIGLLHSVIVLRNGAESRRIEVTASEAAPRSVFTQTTTPTPSPTPSPTPVVAAVSSPTPFSEPPPPEPTPTPKFAPASLTAKVSRLSSDSLRIDWTNPAPSIPCAIEQRYLILDDQKALQVQWVPVPSARITQSGNTGSAIIDDLDANTVFIFRVTQTQGSRLTSLPLTYRTQPTFIHRIEWKSVLFPLAGLLVGFILWKRWQNRESE